MLVATGDAASDQTSFIKLTDCPLNQHQKTIIAKSQVTKFY